VILAIRRELYVAIGVDCDPDRDAYPARLAWRGVEALPRLFDIPDVRWTFNVRADTQVRDYCGSARYCWDEYRPIWDAATARGDAIAWHLHYFGRDGRQDTSEANILENIRVGADALGPPEVVHMGWTFQSDFSIRQLAAVGVRVDYSPVPRLKFGGRGGVDAQDWSAFAYRPQLWHGVRMIPAYTFPHRLLARRFGTERVMLATTTSPLLYRSLLAEFFRSGLDFFVSYFHADELVSALGDWRRRLYSYDNLVENLRRLREMAAERDYRVRFVTIPELAEVLFGDGRTGGRGESRIDHVGQVDERRTRHA
jgi:hypothetical protein